MSELNFMSSVNIITFNFGTSSLALLISIQNIILTIPFGFGVNFLTPIKGKNFLWVAWLVGLTIELTQLIISLMLGYLYRIIDINDVILNALGVLIGYILFRGFALLYIGITNYLGIKHTGLTDYVYKVAKQEHIVLTPQTRHADPDLSS